MVPCSRLSWLTSVFDFWAHVEIASRVVSYRITINWRLVSQHKKWTELTCSKSAQLHDAFIGHALQPNDWIGCSETRTTGAQSIRAPWTLHWNTRVRSSVQFSSCGANEAFSRGGGAATAWKLVKVDEKESTAVICLHVVASSRRDLAGHVGPYARTRAVLSGRKLRRQQLRPESPVTIIERRRRARSITQMSKDDAVYIHNCAAAAGPPRTRSPVAVRHFSPSARATTLNRLAVNWNNMSRDLPRADRTEFLFSVGILSTVTRPIELILLGSGPYSSISNQIERHRFLTFKPYVS